MYTLCTVLLGCMLAAEFRVRASFLFGLVWVSAAHNQNMSNTPIDSECNCHIKLRSSYALCKLRDQI